MTIESFTGPRGKWFDNVRRAPQGIPIRWFGAPLGQARSVEHAYYMQRMAEYAAALAVMRATTGREAKRIAESYDDKIDDWPTKVAIMLQSIHAAVVLNPELAAALEATGDEELVEGNEWNDPIWGKPFIVNADGSRQLGEGYNLTGRAWMMIRELRRSPDYIAPNFGDMVLDRSENGYFGDQARQILAEADRDWPNAVVKLI